MSTQVDRLQALLLRVQNNRRKPRSGGAATVQREVPQVAARAQVAPARPEPQRREARPEPVRAQEPPEFREPPTASVPRPAAAKPAAQAPAAQAPVMQASAPEQPRIIDPAPPQPTRPVAQVVSKHPSVTPQTFGELLRRSLSLRPR